MRNRYAEITAGAVGPVRLYEDGSQPDGSILIPNKDIGVGWQYVGGVFVPPASIVKGSPEWREGKEISVAVFAERLAELGKITWDEAIAWAADVGIPAPLVRNGNAKFQAVRLKSFSRTGVDATAFKSDFGLTDEQLDDM